MFTNFLLKSQSLISNPFKSSTNLKRISTNCSQLNQRVHSGRLEDPNELKEKRKLFFNEVEGLIEKTKLHRNFAIIHLYGCQHLVHEGDVIQIKKDLPAKLGERIKIEKCLLAGNDCLTLIGRPLLDRTKVNIEVTPIEKTQSYTINNHIITRRDQCKRKHRYWRHPITFIRINEITINNDSS